MKSLRAISFAGAALVLGLSLIMAVPTSVHADASATSKGFEFAYVDQTGSVYLKSGSISGTYRKIWDSSDPATNVEVTHNGIAILDQSGRVYVNSVPATGYWNLVTSGVSTRNFALSDSYVYLFLNSTLYQKPLTNLNGAWVSIFSNVQDFDVSAGNTIAAVTTDNALWETYNQQFSGMMWARIATGFSSYSIADNEIAAVFGNQAYVKIGSAFNSWLPAYSNAQDVQLSTNGTIGVTDPAGNLDVAPGGYGSQWVNDVRSGNDSDYTYVADSTITALNGGTVFAKLAGVNGTWYQVAGSGDVIDYSIE